MLIEHLLCARRCAKCFVHIGSFGLNDNHESRYLLQASPRDEEMDVQNGQVICPGTHSIGRGIPRFKPRQLGSRVHMLVSRLHCCQKSHSACESEDWSEAGRCLK